MVRRWSYITEQNSNKNTSLSSLDFIHGEISFIANVYFRKSVSHHSKLVRKSWAKRRHLSNWLPLQTVLYDWSNDYLFFKKYNRFLLTLNVFKNSFLSLNFLLLKKTSKLISQNCETFFFTFPSKRVLLYFSKLHTSTYGFLLKLKHTPLMYISSPTPAAELKKKLPSVIGSAFTWNGNTLSATQSSGELQAIALIRATLLNLIVAKNLESYKMLTLLVLNTLQTK